jgi:hypothetical protein
MLDSGGVERALALVYVFVLVSVLVSAVNELIVGLFKQRARTLWQEIPELLWTGSSATSSTSIL